MVKMTWHVCVCVCVCESVCARACACACVRVCARANEQREIGRINPFTFLNLDESCDHHHIT